MVAVKSKLEHRITKKFFGVTATKRLEKAFPISRRRALKYLAKWYDYENSPFV
jgi:hypothetical protein